MDSIFKTQNYKVVLGSHTSCENPCYQIHNIQYGVIEYETFLLPQAIKYCSDLQAGLDAIYDINGIKKA